MLYGRMFSALIAILVIASPLEAQDERLSLEWMFSEEGKTALSVPQHTWLDNGMLMLYDERVPKAERTIESYNAATDRRRTIVNGPLHSIRPDAGRRMKLKTTSCCWTCARVRSPPSQPPMRRKNRRAFHPTAAGWHMSGITICTPGISKTGPKKDSQPVARKH